MPRSHGLGHVRGISQCNSVTLHIVAVHIDDDDEIVPIEKLAEFAVEPSLVAVAEPVVYSDTRLVGRCLDHKMSRREMSALAPRTVWHVLARPTRRARLLGVERGYSGSRRSIVEGWFAETPLKQGTHREHGDDDEKVLNVHK